MDEVKHHIYSNGDEFWTLDNQCHREDGPAMVWKTGEQFWFQHGKVHRDDGPAVLWNDGVVEWYIGGMKYSFDQYCKELDLTPDQLLELKLKYG